MNTHNHSHHNVSGAGFSLMQWKLLTMLCIVQLVIILDVTVVNIALPSIGHALDFEGAGLSWVLTAYTLTFGSLLLIGGRLADAIGRRRVFLMGVGIFTLASLMCGVSQDGATLIIGRLLQGVGAALASPAALSILTTQFEGHARHRALAIWAAIGGVGSALGVLLGGIMTDGPGWSWIFFINIPLGVVSMVAATRLLAQDKKASADPVDFMGGISLVASASLLIFGLTSAGENGWVALSTIIPLAGALLAGILFVGIESRSAAPLIKLATLGQPNVAAGSLAMLAAAGFLISSFFVMSFFMQQSVGYSALQTGLVFLPVALSMIVASHISARMLQRFGWRPVALGGFTLTAAGYIWLAQATGASNVWLHILPAFMVVGASITAMFVVASTSIMARVHHHEAGLLSGIIGTNHELGAAFGVAIVSGIASSHASFGDDFATTMTVGGIVALLVGVMLFCTLPKGRPVHGAVAH